VIVAELLVDALVVAELVALAVCVAGGIRAGRAVGALASPARLGLETASLGRGGF
jgi:hypothetical protein